MSTCDTHYFCAQRVVLSFREEFGFPIPLKEMFMDTALALDSIYPQSTQREINSRVKTSLLQFTLANLPRFSEARVLSCFEVATGCY
jgi:hypothetical protein